MFEWPGGGWFGAVTLLGAGSALAFVLMGPGLSRLGSHFSKSIDQLKLPSIIASGVGCQIVVALATDPVLNSDPRTYFLLAKKLAASMAYMDEGGRLAFWPPGLPLFLAPFIVLLKSDAVAVAVANITLYGVGCWAAWDLGRRLFGKQAGVIAAALFTIWPSRLLSAGLASKENLTVAMMLAGSTLCVAAFETTGRKARFFAAGSGAAFGLAALTQPGLMLFVAAVPLAYRYAWHRSGRGRFFGLYGIVFVCMLIFVLPWQMRNCVVFEGKFCGIATNGGSVFYRANNPKATGLYIEEGAVKISHLPELEQNRIGFELGIQWIRENPAAFLKLSVKKLLHLVGDDSYGAYWGILRGEGKNDYQSRQNASPARIMAYEAMRWISWVFWVVVAAFAAKGIVSHARQRTAGHNEALLPLIYPLLYSALVFSVFESGSRQHLVALAFLLVLAASSLQEPNTRIRVCRRGLP
jgi:4-amino-4-deoxy-L-arabinose transferase-like glycosyltransferase